MWIINWIESLENEANKSDKYFMERNDLFIKNQELEKNNIQLKSRINRAIEKLTLLIIIGFDYDGFNKIESLKSLIDELVGYAIESREILEGEKND